MMDLQKEYSRDDFLVFLKSFIPDFQIDVRSVNTSGLSSIQKASYLGESKSLDLQVFEFSFEGSPNKRVALTKDAFFVMKSHATFKALAIFHSPGNKDWRFSLMTATPEPTEKGKVSLSYSNPKRLSFFLGPNAKTNTPTKFLISKGKIIDFDDLKKRFSIEVVNKEFYKEISKAFTNLVNESLQLPLQNKGQKSLEFAVRLIGRLIFCWFLKEKKSDSRLSLIPENILSSQSLEKVADLYHVVMEPLFFEILNKQVDLRKPEFKKGPYGKIPYLNGGLFSPQTYDYYKEEYHFLLKVPDDWLRDFVRILELYNFTIDENTSFDVDLSVDPEMLGRILENLLAEINPETGESARKSTGSYYTPREIVEYMVDESLFQFLKDKSNIEEEKLRALISYDLTDDEKYPLDNEDKEKITDALSKVTILDPACGSGAFPIGALQKIVFMLQRVDPEAHLWFQRQLGNAVPEIRRVIEREFANRNFDYIRKLGVIRRSIFGVDIQPIATEIARLRCFLTLIVDERIDDTNKNRGIIPLPNLDFKFVTANSLISLPTLPETTQMNLLGTDEDNDINELKKVRDEYFNSFNSDREHLKKEFYEIRDRLFKKATENNSWNKLTEYLSAWDPFGHKAADWFDPDWMFGIKAGFDIVIANPPYIASYGRQAIKFSTEEMKYYIENYDTFLSVSNRKKISINTVMLFLEKGLSLLKGIGGLSYIIDQAFLNVDVYFYSRKYLVNNSSLQEIVTDLKFPQVVAEACILRVLKNNPKGNYPYFWKKGAVDSSSQRVSTSTIDMNDYQFILSSNLSILKKIEQGSKHLCDCASTYTGMQIIPQYFLSDDDNVLKLPKWHKAVFSSNVYKYKLIWPTKNQKGKYITYDTGLQEKVRTLLKKRIENGEKCRAPETLSIGSLEKESRFFYPKIILSQTVSNANDVVTLQACLDENVGYYGNVSIHLIKHEDINYLKYLLSIINSNLVRFYAIEKKLILGAERRSKKTPQIRKGAMDKLPIASPTHDTQKNLVKLVDKIHSVSKANDYMENPLKMMEVEEYEKQIDQMVYRLYGLTPEEIEIVVGI